MLQEALHFARGFLTVCGFVGLLFLGSLVLPGPVREGAPGPDGARKKYRLNGFALFVLTSLVVAGAALAGLFSPSTIPRHFATLGGGAGLFALVLSLILFLQGRRAGATRAFHDFFYGRELNPSWLGVDLKMFSYRPSLIGLAVINVSFAFLQHEIYGQVSARMWLYQVFYFLYVANYFQFEHGMLFTWDVIAERFGWMLVFGDYVLVPFFYSIPGWYLLEEREPLSPVSAAGLVVLYLVGFWLFRGANEQKHRYKLNPAARIWGRTAESLGGKLLVSGFWGIGRKLNYTGELCMYYAWTLACGFGSLVPYLLPLWLTALLLHRAWRDEMRCREKYGALWAEYCRRARFRMVPFLY